MINILFHTLITFVICSIAGCDEVQGITVKDSEPTEFERISIINQRYFHKYPGTDNYLSSISERPDTMIFYDSENISILIDQAPYNDNEKVIKYDSKSIYVLDKIKDSIFHLLPYNDMVIGLSGGDSIWNKLYKKSSLNLAKATQNIREEFNSNRNVLTLYFDTIVKPNSQEELNLSSVNIHFSQKVKNTKFSISNYYDSLGHGKVIFIEFNVSSFYSNLLQKKVEAFSFYNQIDFHGKVIGDAELKFLTSILKRSKVL